MTLKDYGLQIMLCWIIELKSIVFPEIATKVRGTSYCIAMNAKIHWGKLIECNLFPFKLYGPAFDWQW